jgi:hypothetical protein
MKLMAPLRNYTLTTQQERHLMNFSLKSDFLSIKNKALRTEDEEQIRRDGNTILAMLNFHLVVQTGLLQRQVSPWVPPLPEQIKLS